MIKGISQDMIQRGIKFLEDIAIDWCGFADDLKVYGLA